MSGKLTIANYLKQHDFGYQTQATTRPQAGFTAILQLQRYRVTLQRICPASQFSCQTRRYRCNAISEPVSNK